MVKIDNLIVKNMVLVSEMVDMDWGLPVPSRLVFLWTLPIGLVVLLKIVTVLMTWVLSLVWAFLRTPLLLVEMSILLVSLQFAVKAEFRWERAKANWKRLVARIRYQRAKRNWKRLVVKRRVKYEAAKRKWKMLLFKSKRIWNTSWTNANIGDLRHN